MGEEILSSIFCKKSIFTYMVSETYLLKFAWDNTENKPKLFNMLCDSAFPVRHQRSSTPASEY